MLTVQKESVAEIISMPVADRPIEDLLTREWLLTNSRGGYASSTVIGCNTRRYHGLLIGSVTPLANRIMGLSNCLEMVIVNGRVFNLSTFEFSGKFAPQGFQYIERFSRDTGVHLHYRLNELKTPSSGKASEANSLALTKSVYLLGDTDTVALVYEFNNLERLLVQRNLKTKGTKDSVEFVVRPFVGLRDFHGLQKSYAPLCSSQVGGDLLVHHDAPGSCELSLRCPAMKFRQDPQWWFNFVYRVEQERGQDFAEDLWSPGFFKCRLDSTCKVVLWANLRGPSSGKEDRIGWVCDPAAARPAQDNADIEGVRAELREHRDILIRKARSINRDAQQAMRDVRCEILCLAADQFIVRPQRDHEHRTTVLAGFPWFADWGRDAFISLDGLLLSTGRFEEARSVLTTFARAADEGMIPNRFDDYSGTAYFNSIDASGWFIHAAFQYLSATGDSKTFTQELLPTVRWIVDSFQKGTRFGICADSDGLVTGGSEETQLTWMDA
ncbi:MAG: glycogen debranching enzyme N-terminal domain-containing protein, partial [Planctomycetota bacterium]